MSRKRPICCPICGSILDWKKIDTKRRGFSVGKAIVGNVVLGPVGTIAGGLGHKENTWVCKKCGFSHDYKK